MREKLLVWHWLLIGIFLMIAVGMLFKWDKYDDDSSPEEGEVLIGMMDEGEYTAEITYENIYDDAFLYISLDYINNENNEMGRIISETPIYDKAGIARVSYSLENMEYRVHFYIAHEGEVYSGIRHIEIEKNGPANTDNLFIMLLCILGAIGVFMAGMYLPVEKQREYLVIFMITMVSSMPLFNSLLYDAHDALFHMARIGGIYDGLKNGAFPVYINTVQLFGLGNLSPVMYPSLLLYPFALLRFFGISLVTVYKFTIFINNLVTAIIAYKVAYAVFRRSELSVFLTVMYVFCPYHITNLYNRGAMGEYMAMAFMPLVIYGFYEIIEGRYNRWYILALGMTGIIQTHILSVIIVTCILAVWTICLCIKRKFNVGGYCLQSSRQRFLRLV